MGTFQPQRRVVLKGVGLNKHEQVGITIRQRELHIGLGAAHAQAICHEVRAIHQCQTEQGIIHHGRLARVVQAGVDFEVFRLVGRHLQQSAESPKV